MGLEKPQFIPRLISSNETETNLIYAFDKASGALKKELREPISGEGAHEIT